MDELFSLKELADKLKRTTRYVLHMKAIGFKMPGKRATLTAALEFLTKHPHPCAEKPKKPRLPGRPRGKKK